jgi:hypothetical protein
MIPNSIPCRSVMFGKPSRPFTNTLIGSSVGGAEAVFAVHLRPRSCIEHRSQLLGYGSNVIFVQGLARR